MKFTISRASRTEWHELTDLPHPRAYRGELLEWEREYENWQTKTSYLVKESSQIWYVEFSDLDDLMRFISENGQCVIYSKTDVAFEQPPLEIPHILIYDGYIE